MDVIAYFGIFFGVIGLCMWLACKDDEPTKQWIRDQRDPAIDRLERKRK